MCLYMQLSEYKCTYLLIYAHIFVYLRTICFAINMSKVEFLYIKDFCEFYGVSPRNFHKIIEPIKGKLKEKKKKEKFLPFEVEIVRNYIEKGEK
jgi:hypothetical protein